MVSTYLLLSILGAGDATERSLASSSLSSLKSKLQLAYQKGMFVCGAGGITCMCVYLSELRLRREISFENKRL